MHYHFLFVSVQRSGLQHGDLLKELPVTIRNSRLMNALLCELDAKDTQPKKMDLLGLSSRYNISIYVVTKFLLEHSYVYIHVPYGW